MKGKFSDDFIVFVSAKLDNGTVKYLSYSPNSHSQINDIFAFRLPDVAQGGNWHTFTRDLNQDIQTYLPNNQITSVLDFQVRGNGYLDDMQLLKNGGCDATNTDHDNHGGSSIDLRYKVSVDVDYALKIDNIDTLDTANLPGNIQDQINGILAALQMGNSASTSDTVS